MIIKFLLCVAVVLVMGQIYKRRAGYLPAWKYFQPYSLTYWAGLIPGIAGILIAGEPLTGWSDLAQSLVTATAGIDPQVLIATSAGAVGLTGKFVT
jgi:hypothetical protein